MKRPRNGSRSEFAMGHLIPGRPSILLSNNGKIAAGQNGLTIEYRGKDNCPYGADATANMKPFIGLVLHHTQPDHDTDWYVQYQIDGDPPRGGHFGYHFFIAPDGKIIQGAPLTKRTNHVSPKVEVRRPFGAHVQNTNSIGISCVGAGKPDGSAPTAAQANAVSILAFALCDVFTIPFSSVVGHGEIQTNRHHTEGTALANAIRGWQEEPSMPAVVDARISIHAANRSARV